MNAPLARTGGRLIDADFAGHAEITDFLADLRAGAAARDQNRTLPRAEARRFAELGLGALRIPVANGGHGWTLEQLLHFTHAFGAADPNLAHALRNHFLHVELLLNNPDTPARDAKFQRIVAGSLIGGANSERHDQMGKIETSLLAEGEDFRLNGRKYYSTGAIFADVLSVSATAADGTPRWLSIPADRAGVTRLDDWDGFGQKLTGSGTTVFENVLVHPEEVGAEDIMSGAQSPKQSVFAQIYMTTVVAGIVTAIAEDAVTLLRGRKRAYPHATAPLAKDDPLLQEQVGYLASAAYAARAIAFAAAPAVARIGTTFRAGGDFHAAYQVAALEAGNAKLAIDEIALRAAGQLLDVGGASATSVTLGFDRHWRNARTLSSHNPRVYKARGIGDHLVNGVDLPAAFF